ncbi:MAG: hypothetical protein H0U25_00470 [Thermoleophilaceae bacterium]|nr:hypothetical protein [Thermoleophilaceae bacterium]
MKQVECSTCGRRTFTSSPELWADYPCDRCGCSPHVVLPDAVAALERFRDEEPEGAPRAS